MNYFKLVEDVENGDVSPLKAFALLKAELSLVNEALYAITPELEHILDRYGSQFVEEGIHFEKRTGGPIYDFTALGDWVHVKNELKAIEAKYKQAYKDYERGVGALKGGPPLELPGVKYRKDSLIIKKI